MPRVTELAPKGARVGPGIASGCSAWTIDLQGCLPAWPRQSPKCLSWEHPPGCSLRGVYRGLHHTAGAPGRVTEVSLGSPPRGGDLPSPAIGPLVLKGDLRPSDRTEGRDGQAGGWCKWSFPSSSFPGEDTAVQRLNGEGHTADRWRQFLAPSLFSVHSRILPLNIEQ